MGQRLAENFEQSRLLPNATTNAFDDVLSETYSEKFHRSGQPSEAESRLTASELLQRLESAPNAKESYKLLKQFALEHKNNPTYIDDNGAAHYVELRNDGSIRIYGMNEIEQVSGKKDKNSGPRSFVGNVDTMETITPDGKYHREDGQRIWATTPPKDGFPYQNQGTQIMFTVQPDKSGKPAAVDARTHWARSSRN